MSNERENFGDGIACNVFDLLLFGMDLIYRAENFLSSVIG